MRKIIIIILMITILTVGLITTISAVENNYKYLIITENISDENTMVSRVTSVGKNMLERKLTGTIPTGITQTALLNGGIKIYGKRESASYSDWRVGEATLKAGTYTISTNCLISLTTIYFSIYEKDTTNTIVNVTSTPKTFTIDRDILISIRPYIPSDSITVDIEAYIQIESDTIATPYEPYLEYQTIQYKNTIGEIKYQYSPEYCNTNNIVYSDIDGIQNDNLLRIHDTTNFEQFLTKIYEKAFGTVDEQSTQMISDFIYISLIAVTIGILIPKKRKVKK